jgi:hypothetical protein
MWSSPSCVVHNRLEVARSLIELGAKAEVKDKLGMTPRVCAIKKGFVQMATLLGGGTDADGELRICCMQMTMGIVS